MAYFDAHCHLMADSAFLRAQTKGVSTFIVNATHPAEWEAIADLQNRLLGIYFCAGIHPWYINSAESGWAGRLSAFLKKYPRAMVGEIGLDKKRPFFDQQLAVFNQSLEIAATYNRAVHIHCVGAWDEMFEAISQYRELPMLFHRFSGDEVIIQKLRLFNAYFSVLNGRFIDIIPDKRLLVETDSPDGLRTPSAIPALVQSLQLDTDQLNLNLASFLND